MTEHKLDSEKIIIPGENLTARENDIIDLDSILEDLALAKETNPTKANIENYRTVYRLIQEKHTRR